jgi:Spy/CpxP family protein refolding chaperone
MKRITFLFLPVVAALSLGELHVPNVQAAEPVSPQRSLRGHWLERAQEKLGLTDDQVDKIRVELRAEKATLKGLISNLHDARAGLRQAIQAPDATEMSVRGASAKVAGVEAELAVERLKLYSKISPILTSEQLEKVKEFRAKMDEFAARAIERIGDRLISE